MRVLLTNDDGIGAQGLQALRRALLEIDGIELDVIAPPRACRSGSSRSTSTTAPSASPPTGPRSTASASPSSACWASGPT
jgi:5'/3'-nucleotidase SurE